MGTTTEIIGVLSGTPIILPECYATEVNAIRQHAGAERYSAPPRILCRHQMRSPSPGRRDYAVPRRVGFERLCVGLLRRLPIAPVSVTGLHVCLRAALAVLAQRATDIVALLELALAVAA